MEETTTILVVEDDPSGRAMLALALRQAGFKVLTASGGAEALVLLRRHTVDWMLTDGRMEPMNGFELSAQAKKIQPPLRIAMLSAVYTEHDIDSYPIEAVFSKPIHPERLVSWFSDDHRSIQSTKTAQ